MTSRLLFQSRSIFNTGIRNILSRNRQFSSQSSESFLTTAYRIVFSSNASMVTFILGGAILGATVYGGVTDSIWDSANSGKLYHHVDWSKWERSWADEEDDDDDDDDEDDE